MIHFVVAAVCFALLALIVFVLFNENRHDPLPDANEDEDEQIRRAL